MPTLSLSLLSACLILLPLNCLSSSVYGQSEEFSNYENAKFGYKIQYPKSWHVSEVPYATANAIVTYFNSTDNAVVVIVVVVPTNKTFEQFSVEAIHSITSITKIMNEAYRDMGMTGLISTVETGKATISGMDAWKVTTVSSNFTSIQIWTVKNNYAYSINFVSEHLNSIVYEPVFQRMVNSFQIIK